MQSTACTALMMLMPSRHPGEMTRTEMPDQDQNNGSQRGPLVALGVVVVLFVVGWLLARELSSTGRMEDCLLSGRTNCAPIQTPGQ
jgi:hypothetical protein